MTREELELMWALKAVCQETAAFVLGFAGGELSAAEELAFARRLAVVAEGIRQHGEDKGRLVIDGDMEPAAARELEP